MSSPVINIKGLTHTFPKSDTPTINDLNMKVEPGSIYGLLGQNGSGKTTTLSLILGLLKIQKGSVEIFDQQLSTSRINIFKNVGSLIESPSLYGHLTAEENLEVYRRIGGLPDSRIKEVLETVKLTGNGKKTVRRFSLGMKQRLALALAMLQWPKLLILDEPTNGLDPGGIVEFREIIRRINIERGITVIISSHILSEVEKLVSHVGIIANARMVFEGSLKELYANGSGDSLEQSFIKLTSKAI